MRALTIASLAVLLGSLARADGGFFGKAGTPHLLGYGRVSSTAQQAVILEFRPGREVLLLQTTYSGPAEEFSWIIPVPGLPDEGGVFLASQQFLDEAFNASRPATSVTFLSEQGRIARQVGREGADATLSPGDEMMGGEEGASAGVTVHSRSVVGEYEATVLSTPGGQVLIDWLQGNGFHIPEDAAPIIEQYAAKGWYFVALRVSPAIAKVERIVQDAPPIGIEFASDELVFPLTISRVSAPEWQRLDLVVVGPHPVEPVEMRVVEMGDGTVVPPGDSYGTLRRRLATEDGPRLVCERACPSPTVYNDLSFRADEWGGPGAVPLDGLWATSFFALLRRDDLRDITFTPTRTDRVQRKLGWRLELDSVVQVDRHGRPRDPSRSALWLARGYALGSVALLFAGLVMVVRSARRPGGRWRGILLAVIGLVLGGVWITSVRGEGRSMEKARAAMLSMERALTIIDLATAAFHRDCGCYPASIGDLTSVHPPKTGLDGSGNEVPVGEGFDGPYIIGGGWEEPLAGNGHGWVYDVTGPAVVYPSVFRTTVRRQPSGSLAAGDYWQDRSEQLAELAQTMEGKPIVRVAPGWHLRAKAQDNNDVALDRGRLLLRWYPYSASARATQNTYHDWHQSDVVWGTRRGGLLISRHVHEELDGSRSVAGLWRLSEGGVHKACDRALPHVQLIASHPHSSRSAIACEPEPYEPMELRVVGEDGRVSGALMTAYFLETAWDRAGDAVLALCDPEGPLWASERDSTPTTRPDAHLWRVPLDGSPPAKLADGLERHVLQVSQLGAVVAEAARQTTVTEEVEPGHWATRSETHPPSVLLVDTRDVSRRPLVALPENTFVEDAIVAGDELIVAWYPTLTEGRWGEIRSLDLTDHRAYGTGGKLVARFLSDGGHRELRLIGSRPEGLAAVWLAADEPGNRKGYCITREGTVRELALEQDGDRLETRLYGNRVTAFTPPEGAPAIPRPGDL